MQFARNWKLHKLELALKAGPSRKLARFIWARHYERFFEPIRIIREHDRGRVHGFAMMSLCSLLIETLQCYKFGLPTTGRLLQ